MAGQLGLYAVSINAGSGDAFSSAADDLKLSPVRALFQLAYQGCGGEVPSRNESSYNKASLGLALLSNSACSAEASSKVRGCDENKILPFTRTQKLHVQSHLFSMLLG